MNIEFEKEAAGRKWELGSKSKNWTDALVSSAIDLGKNEKEQAEKAKADNAAKKTRRPLWVRWARNPDKNVATARDDLEVNGDKDANAAKKTRRPSRVRLARKRDKNVATARDDLEVNGDKDAKAAKKTRRQSWVRWARKRDKNVATARDDLEVNGDNDANAGKARDNVKSEKVVGFTKPPVSIINCEPISHQPTDGNNQPTDDNFVSHDIDGSKSDSLPDDSLPDISKRSERSSLSLGQEFHFDQEFDDVSTGVYSAKGAKGIVVETVPESEWPENDSDNIDDGKLGYNMRRANYGYSESGGDGIRSRTYTDSSSVMSDGSRLSPMAEFDDMSTGVDSANV